MHKTFEEYREEARARVPAELLSPAGLPEGRETVWGFLFRTEPWVLADMPDPVEGMWEEDEKAREIAERLGEAPDYVSATGRAIGGYGTLTLCRTFP